MLDTESYHERTSETVIKGTLFPMDVPKGEHPNLNLSVICVL